MEESTMCCFSIRKTMTGTGILSTRNTTASTSKISIVLLSRARDASIEWTISLGRGGAAKGNPRYEVMGVTRYWRYSKERMQELIRQGRVIQTKPGSVPAYKRYLDEMPGVPLQDLWTDIRPIGSQAAERLGYPTQKPVALLERIIQASSNEGDTVLDPFCGCGTTIAAAQKLDRRWVGIDITQLAISLIRYRLGDSFGKDLPL